MMKKINGVMLITMLLLNLGCTGKTIVVSTPNGKTTMKDTTSPIEKFFSAIVPIIFIGGYMMYANKCAETGNCK